MSSHEKIRNMCIIAHIDHGKSTLSDSLLAGAGMLSMKIAGQTRATDTLEEEQQRGITIQASAVSMVHELEDDFFLINMIDTPGHVDFGGEVTRSLRASDGALVLVCAVEGIMPQTETVLRQAIKDRVKPILFINKVDRLLKELELTPQQMQDRFLKIIEEFNKLIFTIAPEELKKSWQVSVTEGSVAFGTAVDRWALSIPVMKKTGLSFANVLESYKGTPEEKKEKIAKLEEKAPAFKVILDMVIRHLPNPIQAQKYRIPKLWKGDLESEMGKALLKCDINGPLCFVITKVIVDPNAGDISFGRLFSGKLEKGREVYLNNARTKGKVQQIFTMVCDKRISQEKIVAGNNLAVIGLGNSSSGETVTMEETEPFESISHIFEPVVTKSIEAKNPADLPKLIQVLRDISKEDPTIRISINEETGESLMSGLGELHLEWTEHKIVKYKKLDVITGKPIVVYRESVEGTSSEPFEGKSPNKHNKFYFVVEPLEKGVYDLLVSGELSGTKIRKKEKEAWQTIANAGMEKEEAKSVRYIYGKNMLLDMTKGEVHIGEVIEMVYAGMKQAIDGGGLAREPVEGLKIKLVDIKLHEDSIHRGPGQIIPAAREGIRGAMNTAKPVLWEPVQIHRIDAPLKYLGNITNVVQSKRGKILDMKQTEALTNLKVKMPVSEMFGFTGDLRSATEGRGVSSLMDSMFEKIPKELQEPTIKKILERKGIKKEE